jgi:hypothetical protein
MNSNHNKLTSLFKDYLSAMLPILKGGHDMTNFDGKCIQMITLIKFSNMYLLFNFSKCSVAEYKGGESNKIDVVGSDCFTPYSPPLRFTGNSAYRDDSLRLLKESKTCFQRVKKWLGIPELHYLHLEYEIKIANKYYSRHEQFIKSKQLIKTNIDGHNYEYPKHDNKYGQLFYQHIAYLTPIIKQDGKLDKRTVVFEMIMNLADDEQINVLYTYQSSKYVS